MSVSFRTVYEGGVGEVEEKKSRFIAETAHVETEEEAIVFLDSVRKKYYDARHHCYAYILGPKGENRKCSDDGEPSQTAGKPILDVLSGNDLRDTILVVTRYFGGTLLGTGGLVRAYSAAAREGVRNSRIIEKKPALRLYVTVDYNGIGKLLYMLGQKGYSQLDSEYGADVTLLVLVPEEEADGFRKELVNQFSGNVLLEEDGTVYYAVIGKRVVQFGTVPEIPS